MILNYTIKREVKSIYKSKDLVSFLKTQATLKTFTKYHPASVEVSYHQQILSVYLSIQINLGAYGEVRKCLHKETKALRAVKIIQKKFLE